MPVWSTSETVWVIALIHIAPLTELQRKNVSQHYFVDPVTMSRVKVQHISCLSIVVGIKNPEPGQAYMLSQDLLLHLRSSRVTLDSYVQHIITQLRITKYCCHVGKSSRCRPTLYSNYAYLSAGTASHLHLWWQQQSPSSILWLSGNTDRYWKPCKKLCCSALLP